LEERLDGFEKAGKVVVEALELDGDEALLWFQFGHLRILGDVRVVAQDAEDGHEEALLLVVFGGQEAEEDACEVVGVVVRADGERQRRRHELVEEEEAEVVFAAVESEAIVDAFGDEGNGGNSGALLWTLVGDVEEVAEEGIAEGKMRFVVVDDGPVRWIRYGHGLAAHQEDLQEIHSVAEEIIVDALNLLQQKDLFLDRQSAGRSDVSEFHDILREFVGQIPLDVVSCAEGNEAELEAESVGVGMEI
jgi:hypothetical protein